MPETAQERALRVVREDNYRQWAEYQMKRGKMTPEQAKIGLDYLRAGKDQPGYPASTTPEQYAASRREMLLQEDAERAALKRPLSPQEQEAKWQEEAAARRSPYQAGQAEIVHDLPPVEIIVDVPIKQRKALQAARPKKKAPARKVKEKPAPETPGELSPEDAKKLIKQLEAVRKRRGSV